ncbi:MAG TPA: aminotransferase class V-fold PLP-dependent enzyme [Fibrobacteria bacterium]|nr:aminotransferase class V-fold PLP-dependent enzyme [Fibrobacteria bacterium]
MSTSPRWEEVQADFPVNHDLIWMNNCGTTPAGRHVLAAMGEFLEGYASRGVLTGVRTYPEVKGSIKRRLAALLNADPEELALIHNTSEGMNFISHGLSLVPGDEILVLENEYPSNYYPWEHWRAKGVVLRTVPCGSSPRDFLASFEAALEGSSGRPRVAALSAVHWCTGMPLPLQEAGRMCAVRRVDLVVDGAQGVGLVDLDMRACGILAMAFSAWKWLLGPLGLGVLYVDRRRLGDLRTVFKGAESVVQDEGYLPYKEELKPGADRFTHSTANFNDWVYFESSLAYLDGIGFPRVRARILELADRLRDGLRSRGFSLLSDGFGGARTGIVVAVHPNLDAAVAVRALKDRGIIAAERLGRIRLAPHIYNSEAQVDRVVEELADLAVHP